MLSISLLFPEYRSSAQQGQMSQKEIFMKISQSQHPQSKAAVRYNIDAKRMVTDINSNEVLARSREFIRTDSTYYVGWLYEGYYKYDHAADYLGFKNAIVPLEKALNLLEHDYKTALSTRTHDVIPFISAAPFQQDYQMIANYLWDSYNNTDQPQKAFALLRRTLKWNFQFDTYMDSYNLMAWTVHRNRFYQTTKYPFLRNSIDENEKLAYKYLDSQLKRIDRNRVLNEGLITPGILSQDKLRVYHYKSVLYSYNLDIDSAAYYYDLMRAAPNFSHNNFGTFRAICGDFRNAEAEYKLAAQTDNGDKHLKEFDYYQSILDIYKSQPKTGIVHLTDLIKAVGSTPGFGWYNIGLSRCLQYDGQILEAKRIINKAAEFKETHIGTSLGQTHYDFSIQLIKLRNIESEWEMQRFEHRNWWYNPVALTHMAGITADKYTQQFLIINQFVQNPERDKVIYKLFSTESTVSWDEIWYLLEDFTTQFFIDHFQKEIQTDKRKYIQKYFSYFVAKFKMKQGKYKEAAKIFDDMLASPTFDNGYEKLFVARIYEAKAQCAKELKNESLQLTWMNKLYAIYPQLVPFSGMQMPMHLHVAGSVDKEVVSHLKDCNINWDTKGGVPNVYITFSNVGKRKDIQYYVTDATGQVIVAKQSFAWQKPDDGAISLAYRIFNIGGKTPDKDQATVK